MEQELTFHVGSANGHPLPRIESEEWKKIEAAYAEIQRRDGRAEDRAHRSDRFALAMLGLWSITLGIMVWQFLNARGVEPFVQVVVQDDQGKLIQTGVPQKLLHYTPADGQWMDMLAQWVQRRHWRGEDIVRAKTEWAWLYRHACSTARRILQKKEEDEQPFKPGKKVVAVEVKAITKLPAPESYQVLWTETATDKTMPMVGGKKWRSPTKTEK